MCTAAVDRVMFFLGSGASQPAGFPLTEELTRRVVSGEGIVLHTDGTYYLSSPEEAHAAYRAPKIQEVVRFIGAIREEADRYYLPGSDRSTNYEDLYFLCRQVFECVSREADNPAVLPLVEKLADRIEAIAQRSIPDHSRTGAVADLAADSVDYVQDVAWRLLTIGPSRLDHLDFVVNGILDLGARRVSVTTLNHDRCIDLVLQRVPVRTTDGFGEALNEVRYWHPDWLRRRRGAIPVLKLHGDVTWFEFDIPEGERRLPRIGCFAGEDYWHTKTERGVLQWPSHGRPLLLIGTINKITQYHERVFIDLQSAFLRELRRTKTIVCAGYGFGDKGINRRILEWIFECDDRRIVVLHPDPTRLKERARPAIARYWDALESWGRLHIVPKRVGEATWEDIKIVMP